MNEIHPVDARVPDADHLVVSWSDGRTLVYPLDLLRAKCPCAQCVDEWTGAVKVRREMFPGITLKSLDEAGNYAFKIAFSDGHATGIYTWRLLLGLGLPPAAEGDTPFTV
jgi:DUF971 family protein